MKRVLYYLATLLGGVVLILLFDPTRPLLPIFILLALAVVCAARPALKGAVQFLDRSHGASTLPAVKVYNRSSKRRCHD